MPEEKTEQGITLSEWTIPEFEHHKRGGRWWFFAVLIGGAILLSAIVTANFLFVLTLILITLLFVAHEQRGARTFEVKVTDRGIVVGASFYPYEALEHFRVAYEPPNVQHLYISFPQIHKPMLSIPLNGEDPNEISEILSEFLDEDFDNEGEPVSESISRILKI